MNSRLALVLLATALASASDLGPIRTPTDVVLAFDCSRQMRTAGLWNPGALSARLLAEADNLRIAVYGFSDHAYRLAPPTHDAAELQQAAEALRHLPATPLPLLYRSMIEIMTDAIESGAGRDRVMIVLSEGLDHACMVAGNDPREALRVAGQPGFRLYPVALIPEVYGAQEAAIGPFKRPSGERPARDPQQDQVALDYRQFFLSMGEKTGGAAILRYNLANDAILQILQRIGKDSRPVVH